MGLASTGNSSADNKRLERDQWVSGKYRLYVASEAVYPSGEETIAEKAAEIGGGGKGM